MPIDPSIPLQVRGPQGPDPLQQLATVMNLRAIQESHQKAQREDALLRRLFIGETLPSPRAIIQVVGVERGVKIAEALKALQTDPRGDFDATQQFLRKVIVGMDALPVATRAEVYPVVRGELVQRGVIRPTDAPEQYDQTWWVRTREYGQVPEKPGTRLLETIGPTGPMSEIVADVPGTTRPRYVKPDTSSNLEQAIVAAASQGNQAEVDRLLILAGDLANKKRGPSDEPVHAILGPDNKPIYVRRSDAVGKTPAWQERPLTQGEFTAAGYAGRMEQAEQTFSSLADTIGGMNPASFNFQQWIDQPWLQSRDMQVYLQAARNFINAVLRRESGAVISESEFAEARQQYLPQPGDSETVKRQKRANREYVTQTMKRAAGEAYQAPLMPATTGAPTIGERRIINGRLAEWDGRGWKAVPAASPAPVSPRRSQPELDRLKTQPRGAAPAVSGQVTIIAINPQTGQRLVFTGTPEEAAQFRKDAEATGHTVQ